MFRYNYRICQKIINNPLNLNNTIKRNAGHSKWANIKHTKDLKDKQKSRLFAKFGIQIRVAIQEGGSDDPKKNLKLEQVIQQAKRMSMPIATLESILKSTKTDKTQCKSYLLEIKGPGSCIILCDVFTENLHGLKQNLQTILKKHISKFSDGGGIHAFNQKGVIITEPLDIAKTQEETLELATEHAIEAGAEDVRILEEGEIEFSCSANTFYNVQGNLTKLNYKLKNAEVDYIPLKFQTVSDTDLEVCAKLFEKLENHPDIIKLYDNIG